MGSGTRGHALLRCSLRGWTRRDGSKDHEPSEPLEMEVAPVSTSYTVDVWNQEWGQIFISHAAGSIGGPKWKVGGYGRFGW